LVLRAYSLVYAMLLGFFLDILFGDPQWITHPIIIMGKIINNFEDAFLPKVAGKSARKQRRAGFWFALCCIAAFTGIFAALGNLFWRRGHFWHFCYQAFACFIFLAAKGLKKESMKVYDALKSNDIEKARYEVSMLVSRDTAHLDVEGISKACIETVAENACDAFVAPMMYFLLGGAVGIAFYKAVNTLDSMVGYKNDKYLHFGWFSAKLDDVLNFIPARAAGFIMALSADLAGFSSKRAMKIFWRDRLNHDSPNSAHTEAACAGALGIKLGGDSYYFGQVKSKPTIGDSLKPVEAEDIARANKLVYLGNFVCMILFIIVKLAIWPF